MNLFKTKFLLPILAGMVFLYSCEAIMNSDPGETSDVIEEGTAIDFVFEAQKHYYYAYLAYCVNAEKYRDVTGGASGAQAHIQQIAQERIKGANTNKALQAAFGKDTLVWGPFLAVNDQGDASYVSENLLYCIKKVGAPEYYVGIAGTNMMSPYDWFVEDLQTNEQVDWLVDGKISKGAQIGFNILNGFMDTDTGLTLVEFLKQEVDKSPAATISVAGHSLGGALTQVYASYLNETLSGANVQAWVYAGPSAGDKTFADSLNAQLDAYHAYNNKYDMIPHAWEKDKLEELCTLYNGMDVCGTTLASNLTLNAIVKYFLDESEEGNYQTPGTPDTFSIGQLKMTTGACDSLKKDIHKIWKYGDFNDVYKYLNDINKSCTNGSKISEPAFYQFFYQASEMGGQHTTAYFNYFFQGRTSDFYTAIHQAVPSAKMTTEREDEARIIIEKFLKEVKNKGITDCTCSSKKPS